MPKPEKQTMSRLLRGCTVLAAGMVAIIASSCLDRELAPLNPCLVSTVSRKVAVSNIDKVDLLFAVDNSVSMASKQNSLKAQFPHMIQVLSTGRRTPNDPNPFPAVKDMHLAVVSSDMGTVGVQSSIETCDPNGGDDGRFKHVSSGDPGCQAMYPAFLSYNASHDDPMQIGVDFGCIASLGVTGCNIEQQLESPLRALWPAVYSDAKGNVVSPNPITFLPTPGAQTMGRGDMPPPEGGAGFLRNDPASPSLLAIVVLTDEDDQSSQKTDYLRAATDANDPLTGQNVLVRPFLNMGNLYDVKRYVNGFKMLRADHENLVVFAAITGVPTDLVDARARAAVDFTDAASRNTYYDRIANDRRMQPVVAGAGLLAFGINPACTRINNMGQAETAAPARRILDVVRGFDENGTFQSICANDYGPAMDAIIEIIARQLGAVCLPRPLVRRADGFVPCNVVWELPPAAVAPVGSPTQCSALPYLKPVESGRPAVNERGGNNCVVAQLPVTGTTVPNMPGWYYDNFSAGVMQGCAPSRQQRVTFTDAAKPPNGVVIKLECLNEIQSVSLTRSDISTSAPQPEIGSSCENVSRSNGRTTAIVSGDAACVVALTGGKTDNSMFCHPELNVCVQGCKSSTNCPPAWVCDDRPSTTGPTKGRAYCANPTCGVE